MRTSRFPLIVVLFMFLFSGINAFAGTYYIDCAGGSDSNSGTSQTSAWLHHPYMVGFKGSYSHTPGDQFYFKGGVTCPNSYFPLTVAAGGSSGSVDYYGPDPSKAWYTGTSWTRPIMSPGGSVLATSANDMFLLGSNSYVTFDNFEITGMRDSGDNVYQHNVAFLMVGNSQTVENMYFHGWVETGAPFDDLVFIQGCNQSCDQTNDLVSANYCNGADATPPSTSNGSGSSECIRYVAGTIQNNVMLNESNGIVAGGGTYNTIVQGNDVGFIYTSFDSTNHENGMEMTGPGASGNIFANNTIHDLMSVGVFPVVFGPSVANTVATEWVTNNVCWNVPRVCFNLDTSGGASPGYTLNFINNSCNIGGVCLGTTSRGSSNSVGTVNVINNHIITPDGTDAESFCFNSGNTCSGVTNLVKTTNTLMAAATAASQGYTLSEHFVLSPTLASNSTVGAGTNEASQCTGNMASLCQDTTYSCSVTAGNVVSCPMRTTNTRSGNWDTGAYLFEPGPNPPSQLQAVVQ